MVCEFCNRRTRKLLGRAYELLDTALTLLGVKVFVVVQRFRARVGLGNHPLVLLYVQKDGYALSIPCFSLLPNSGQQFRHYADRAPITMRIYKARGSWPPRS